jgi:membrane protease YdiL (CAAX protease family)
MNEDKKTVEDYFYSEIKNPEEELNELNRSLDLCSKMNYSPDLAAKILLKLGQVYTELEDYSNALESYQVAFELFRDENIPEGEGYTIIGLGRLSEKYNKYPDSRRFYTRALEIAQQINNPKMEKEISTSIARTYNEEGYLDDAMREYEKLNEPDSNDSQVVKYYNGLNVTRLKKELFLIKPTKVQVNLLIFYLLFIMVSELLTAYNYLEAGLLANVALIVLLIINSSLTKFTNFSNLLRALIIIPLVRIIGLSIPSMQMPHIYLYALASVPLFAAAFILIKNQHLSRQSLGLIFGKVPIQLIVGLSGIIFGIIEYQILKPAALISSPTLVTILLGSIILLISTGLAEEIIYRGIIQKHAENVLGKIWGLLYASVLFTLMYIGWQSSIELIFVFLVALFYGYIFQRTRSIFGISLSHGLTNILLFIIIPTLILS